ncbi:MAG TPA: DUF6008 family protein [Stellaceae bacterium]|jgi:hypothetical protein|nr:DUF6008 family protein [Stellaceae bacterium]
MISRTTGADTKRRNTLLCNILIACVGLGLAFQVGHFIEHAVQFGVWIAGEYAWVTSAFCGRDTPYMSPPLTAMVRFAGAWLFPEADASRQMMLGMELLHLAGNTIFLVTIAGVNYLMPSKWARYAFYIEGGHLCEHLALCLTAYYVGKPIALSTLFGQAPYYFGKNGAVGYRVAWHFAMNLLPMPFVMIGMMKYRATARLASGPALTGAVVPGTTAKTVV